MQIQMNTFAPLLVVAVLASGANTMSAQAGGVGITVWTNSTFGGESATFRSAVPNRQTFGLSGKISSLRIGPGEYWEGCEAVNFGGRCQVFTGEERNLGRTAWNDRIVSLRRVRFNAGEVVSPRRLDVFRSRNLSGMRMTLQTTSTNTGVRLARSAQATGRWQVCAGTNFRPPCREITGRVDD